MYSRAAGAADSIEALFGAVCSGEQVTVYRPQHLRGRFGGMTGTPNTLPVQCCVVLLFMGQRDDVNTACRPSLFSM